MYARRANGTYAVVQCKRRIDRLTPAEITAAVDRFLSGDWATTASTFVLAVSSDLTDTQSASRIELERERLAHRDITLVVWDETELSVVLKDHPSLVDDFFGRDAVKVFLGAEVANSLGDRLDVADVLAFRYSLGRLYSEVFQRLERGVHADDRNVLLKDRFVVQDVLVSESRPTPPVEARESQRQQDDTPIMATTARSRRQPSVVEALRNPANGSSHSAAGVRHEDRVSAIDWLRTGQQHLVLGSPGSGKSALLRMVVLDVFATEPLFIDGDLFLDVIPVWLPFAFWTNVAQADGSLVSLLDAVHKWLDAYDHGHLWPLVERALRDERLLLVVDGLDEWASPDLARVCVDRLEVFASTNRARVLASSRPVGTADIPIDMGAAPVE